MKGILIAALPCSLAVANDVVTGIDVLAADQFRLIDGARIGLITNHTGISRNGRSTIQVLHEAKNVELVRIFSPEHGIAGALDVPVIADATDTGTGIPVISLYGSTRRPEAATLADIDALLFDIQDIGARYYTYVSTMANSMQAAAEHGVTFVVLDRPNPINGTDVQGPVLDEGRQSFVGFHTIPVRHGMTVAELALMYKNELELDLELLIVRMQGWKRHEYFDNSGLPWVNPSPNMRSLAAALLYPGIGLLETTNISVGRGTDTPFEILGAPWLDSAALMHHLQSRTLPGISITATSFTPNASRYSDQLCHGIRIEITDRQRMQPLRLGLEIAAYLAKEYEQRWDLEAYQRLLGNAETLQAIRDRHSLAEIQSAYQQGLDQFKARRRAFLLYD